MDVMVVFDKLFKWVQGIIAFVLSLIIPTLPAASVIGYGGYEPIVATQREYRFDIDRFNVGGYGYNLALSDDEHFAQIKEAGLDFLVTSVNDALLDYCDENGIGIVAHGLNTKSGYIWRFNPDSVLNLTKESFKDRPCLWGDSIIDEPCSTEFDKVAKAVDHYYSLGTKTLPLVNLLPNYFKEDQAGFSYPEYTDKQTQIASLLRNTPVRRDIVPILTMFNEELYNKIAMVDYCLTEQYDLYKQYVSNYISKVDTDVICVDFYPMQQYDTTTFTWLNNLDVLAEACRETGRKLWIHTQTCGGKTPDEADGRRFCDNVEDIRYQTYVSLAFGAKAVIHACYSSGWWDPDAWLINKRGEKTATFDAVKQTNEEIAAFTDLYANYDYKGTFFKNGHMADGTGFYAYLSPVSREDRGCEIDDFDSVKDHILAGCFKAKQGNSRAYTFVNMNGKFRGAKAYCDVTFDDAKQITVYQKGVATVIDGNELSLKLDCEEGVFVKVE
ncbi:MAG: hypothetical protein IJU39_06675 [Clostridia bacterium]|nr:hypothetical protein [Clostridia bacterium]